MTELIVQVSRHNETCRMVGHSSLSNNINFVEVGFEWLGRKTTFLGVLMQTLHTKSAFFNEIFLEALDTYAEKI